MNTLTASNDFTRHSQSVSFVRMLALETRMETLRLLRNPSFAIPTMAFPVMFYLLFGVFLLGTRMRGTNMAAHLFGAFLAFGVVAPGLFGLGVGLAMDRERGLLQLKRALPIPAGLYLTAKLLVAALLSSTISLALMLCAATLGKVSLDVTQWLNLFAVSLLGCLPFCGLGCLIGSMVKGQAAPAIINLLYLPMNFLSGVLLPLAALPEVLRQWAPIWPTYHLTKLTANIIDRQNEGAPPHVVMLLSTTVLCFAFAQRRLRTRL
ncbi:MAG: ABC transporter permease [Steroidobacteraceae bacterium]